MTDIVIAEKIKRQFIEPFGIEERQINDALSFPDEHQTVYLEDSEINVYLKTFCLLRPPISIVIIERSFHDGKPAIHAVYTTYLTQLGMASGTKPIEVLKTLADKFGAFVHISNSAGKFFGEQTFAIAPETERIDIVTCKEDCCLLPSFHHAITKSNECKIAFVFAIKANDYLNWLLSQKTGSDIESQCS